MPNSRTTHDHHAHARAHLKPAHDQLAHPHHHTDHAPATARPAATADSSEVEYTCPMHPQVRQTGPGDCPICGMALEPVLATAGQGESPELRDMTHRFRVGAALTVPVFALEMGAICSTSTL